MERHDGMVPSKAMAALHGKVNMCKCWTSQFHSVQTETLFVGELETARLHSVHTDDICLWRSSVELRMLDGREAAQSRMSSTASRLRCQNSRRPSSTFQLVVSLRCLTGLPALLCLGRCRVLCDA